jgi:hypothetical protein
MSCFYNVVVIQEKETLKESVAILERKANGLANEAEESR